MSSPHFSTHNVPPNVSQYLSNPSSPWELSPGLARRAEASPNHSRVFKLLDVFPNDPEWKLAWAAFNGQKPGGLGINRIRCIHHPQRAQTFVNHIKQNELKGPKFPGKWRTEPPIAQREKINERWNHFTSNPTFVDKIPISHVKVFPVWHGTKEKNIYSICETGFEKHGKHQWTGTIHSAFTDDGFYGDAYYFATNAKAAKSYGENILILTLVACREPFPVADGDLQHLRGKGHRDFYDTHYIPVDPNFPCKEGKLPTHDEVCVFEQVQTYPYLLIYLQADLLLNPSLQVKTTEELLHVVMGILNKDLVQSDPELTLALEKQASALLLVSNRAFLTGKDRNFFNKLLGLIQLNGEIDQMARLTLLQASNQREPLRIYPQQSTLRQIFNFARSTLQRTIEVPLPPLNQGNHPLSLILEDVNEGNINLAWDNLLILLADFLSEASEKSSQYLYDILDILVPQLPLTAKDDLLSRVLHPLQTLGFQQEKRLQLELTIAHWLVTRIGVPSEKAHQELHLPAARVYKNALALANELNHHQCHEIVENASRLLSARISERMTKLAHQIDRSLADQNQTALEEHLKTLTLIRNVFCLTIQERKVLVPLYEKMAHFFAIHPLSTKELRQHLSQGQRTNLGHFPEPYIIKCQKTLTSWRGTFAAEALLITFPNLVSTLDGNDNGVWNKGMELQLALLGEIEEDAPFSPLNLLKLFTEKRPETSLIKYAIEIALTSKNKEDVEQYLPMFVGNVEFLIQKGTSAEEHSAIYHSLSKQSLLERFRASYLDTLPPGRLVDQLALVPNRDGFRQKMRLDQQNLRTQLDLITDTRETAVKVTTHLFESPRYLRQELINQLDSNGHIKRAYAGSAHAVCRMENDGYDLHFKENPSHPMQEYAVWNLASRLCGTGAPPSGLIRLDVKLPGQKEISYPVAVSLTVQGRNLKTVLAENPNHTFANNELTKLLLLRLVTRPGDERASNFVVTEGDIPLCVDNDVSFVIPIVDHFLSREINFKSILFCLQQGPLDSEALREWLNHSPDLLLESWILDLIQRESEYTALFSQEETDRLYRESTFTPRLVLRQGTVTTIFAQLNQLQIALKEQLVTSGLDLLKHLVLLRGNDEGPQGIGHRLHRYYTQAFTNKPTPQERLLEATKAKTDRSKTSIEAMRAGVGKDPTLEEIRKMGPFSLEKLQAEFRSFAFFNQEGTVATLANGKLAIRCDFTNILQDGVPDLERQKVMLEALKLWKRPESVTLIGCAALTSEELRPFLHEDLVYLDLRGSAIDSLPGDIQKCPIKELNLSGCPNLYALADIGFFYWKLNLPHLETLEAIGCPILADVRIKAEQIKVCNLRHNPKLLHVGLYGNIKTVVDYESTPILLEESVRSRFGYLITSQSNETTVELSREFYQSIGSYIHHLVKDIKTGPHQKVIGKVLLDLIKTRSGIKHFETIENFDFSKLPPISLLTSETRNRLGYEETAERESPVDALLSLLPFLPLTHLDLENWDLDSLQLQSLAKILPNSQITHLNLSRNKHLVSGYGKYDNTEKGIQELITSLPKSKITHLFFSDCIGLSQLSKALPKTRIQHLELRNQLINLRFKGLTKILPPTLTFLDIRDNQIQDETANKLVQALALLPNITVDLRDNQVSEPVAEELKVLLPTLQI